MNEFPRPWTRASELLVADATGDLVPVSELIRVGNLHDALVDEVGRLSRLNKLLLRALRESLHYVRCPHTKRQEDCSRCVFAADVELLANELEQTP